MGSMWRNAMRYLGLAPDDEFEDYDDEPERQTGPIQRTPAPVQSLSRQPIQAVPQRGPAPSGTFDDARQPQMASVRPLPVTSQDVGVVAVPREVARPRGGPAFARPNVVLPHSFGDAQEVADRFKANQPVIMNLQGLERDLARRLIDFASGMCYGLSGQMDRVAKDVFLLTPADVQVPDEEMRRLKGRADEP
jgi:cell division inhibitor SepF